MAGVVALQVEHELALARVQAGGQSGVVHDVERARLVRHREVATVVQRLRRPGIGVQDVPMVHRDRLPCSLQHRATGQHAGVIGQRVRVRVVGARIERRGALGDEALEGARAVRIFRHRRLQEIAAQPIDTDVDDVRGRAAPRRSDGERPHTQPRD